MSAINKTASGFDEFKARIGKQLDDGKMYLEQRPYISTGLRGAALGAGTFATIAAVKEVLDLIEDRKKKKKAKNPTLSSDTIVISLPDKNKEKLASARDFALEEAKKHYKKPTDGSWRQARHEDGTFASGWELDLTQPEEKNAQEKVPYKPGWAEEGFNMGLSGATGVIGAGLGWVLAQKTYDYLKKKRLKREIAAAQKEYIDFLTNEKDAQLATGGRPGPINNLLHGEITMPDGATEALRGAGKYSIGAVTSTAVLLALASTYLTKKFLDQKFNDLDTKTTINDKPGVNNIVFKTAEAEEIPITPLDAIAAVKFAELMMEADSAIVEKKAQVAAFDGTTVEDDDYSIQDDSTIKALTTLLGISEDELFDAYVNNRDGLMRLIRSRVPPAFRAKLEKQLPAMLDMADSGVRQSAMDRLMEALEANGYQGGANDMSPDQLNRLENVRRYFNQDDAAKDATMKLFLSDRYKKQREAMATNYLNNWYNDSWFGKAFGADSGFGNLMKRIMGWFGRYYANTETGGKNIYNRMMRGIDGALQAQQQQQQPAAENTAGLQPPPNPDEGASPEAAALLSKPEPDEPHGLPAPEPAASATPAQPAAAGSGLAPVEPTWGPEAPASRTVGHVEPAEAQPPATAPMRPPAVSQNNKQALPPVEAPRPVEPPQGAGQAPAVTATRPPIPTEPVAPPTPRPVANPEQLATPAAEPSPEIPNTADTNVTDDTQPAVSYINRPFNTVRKTAGILDSKLLAATARLAVATDTRNDALNGKLDQIIAAQAKANGGSKGRLKSTINVIAADPNANEVIKKKKQLIEQVLRELKVQGKI